MQGNARSTPVGTALISWTPPASFVVLADDRQDYGEERFITFGLLRDRLWPLRTPSIQRQCGSFQCERQQGMRKRVTSRRSTTDWKRIRKMKDSDIDLSDLPEVTPEMFARAVFRRGLKEIKASKVQLTVRLDRAVLDWYRSRGRGYQTQINALLRAFMEASRTPHGSMTLWSRSRRSGAPPSRCLRMPEVLCREVLSRSRLRRVSASSLEMLCQRRRTVARLWGSKGAARSWRYMNSTSRQRLRRCCQGVAPGGK
jgi:uncharacterized protein (DUF4415 family)